jgi:hypothetical protein
MSRQSLSPTYGDISSPCSGVVCGFNCYYASARRLPPPAAPDPARSDGKTIRQDALSARPRRPRPQFATSAIRRPQPSDERKYRTFAAWRTVQIDLKSPFGSWLRAVFSCENCSQIAIAVLRGSARRSADIASGSVVRDADDLSHRCTARARR